jgi:hypothetical protein
MLLLSREKKQTKFKLYKGGNVMATAIREAIKDAAAIAAIDEDTNNLLNWCVSERARLKSDRDAIDAEIESVNLIIISELDGIGLNKFESKEGSVSVSSTTRSTLDKKKMIIELVGHGVSAAVVSDAIEAATKIGESKMSVRFIGVKVA